MSVNASGINYAKSFPKELNGKWYAYTNFGYGKKKIYKENISSKRFGFLPIPVPKHQIYLIGKKALSHNPHKHTIGNWSYFRIFNIYGYKWFNLMGWYQNAGDGTYFNVSNFHGNKVLTEAEGADCLVDAHYYKSKSLAKKMGQKKYPKFHYSNI